MLAITAPIFINNRKHLDYLNEMTNSIVTEEPYIFIPVENHISNDLLEFPYEFLKPPKEVIKIRDHVFKSVAGAWNEGIAKAVMAGCEFVLVVNTDIVFKKSAIDNLINFARKNPEYALYSMYEWTDKATIEEATEYEGIASPYPHFSAFLVRPSLPTQLMLLEKGQGEPYPGIFDVNFEPAYCEDNDFAWRLKKQGLKYCCYQGARFFHYGSRTIREDVEMWNKNTQTFPKNQSYFLRKWGHPVVSEEEMEAKYYKRPFNNS